MSRSSLSVALGVLGVAACAATPRAGAGPTTGLVEGDLAPDFRLESDAEVWTSLSQHRGKDNVLLMFFPLAFTPV